MTLSPEQLAGTEPSMENVAVGQKFIIYAILLNISMVCLRVAAGQNDVVNVLSLIFGVTSMIMSIVGLFKLSDGLGYSIGMKVLLILVVLVPLVGLIALLSVNSRATKALKSAGYKVGLFGASR